MSECLLYRHCCNSSRSTCAWLQDELTIEWTRWIFDIWICYLVDLLDSAHMTYNSTTFIPSTRNCRTSFIGHDMGYDISHKEVLLYHSRLYCRVPGGWILNGWRRVNLPLGNLHQLSSNSFEKKEDMDHENEHIENQVCRKPPSHYPFIFSRITPTPILDENLIILGTYF